LKILNVIQGTHIGGMEQSSLLLMRELISLGHDISLLSLTKMGLLKKDLEESNIKSRGFPYKGPGGLLDLLNYRSYISSEKADAIMQTGHSLVGMLSLLGRKNIPKILFVHFHHQGVKPKWIWKLIYLVANRIFHHIYFASNFIRDEALLIHPELEKKSSFLPNPLPTRSIRTEKNISHSRSLYNIQSNEFVIGNAGWLIKRKRFDILLRVSAKIKESLPNLKVLIAGDGEEKVNLEELADELDISTDIIWLGWQEDLENFYNAIDVMLFNSDWDAVGLSPLESIQRGIPTYTSVINGGLKEILTGEFSIFIENQHDINILANKILESVHDKENLTDITMKCRDHVNSISKPENIAEQVLSKIKNRG